MNSYDHFMYEFMSVMNEFIYSAIVHHEFISSFSTYELYEFIVYMNSCIEGHILIQICIN